MNKMMGSAMIVGALLASGAGATEPDAGDSIRDAWRLQLADSGVTRSALFADDNRDWSAGDGRSEGLLLADLNAPVPRSSGPNIGLRASNAGASVAVTHNFSTWSDMTALFRPSRWRNPLRPGGSLSWMNYKSWRDEPGRTGKVLLGEVIVVGAGYAIYEATKSSGSSGNGSDPAPASAPSAPSGGGGGGGSRPPSDPDPGPGPDPDPGPGPDPDPDPGPGPGPIIEEP
jgi:hypothetical protein